MTIVSVKCDDCGHVTNVDTNENGYEEVDSTPRQQGNEITSEAEVETECGGCGRAIKVTHRVWEYPEGVENDDEIEVEGATKVPTAAPKAGQ